MRKILSPILIGLFIVLGIVSIFANSEKFEVKITGISYDENTNEFDVDFDLEDVDDDLYSKIRKFFTFSVYDSDITVHWIQDPQTGHRHRNLVLTLKIMKIPKDPVVRM